MYLLSSLIKLQSISVYWLLGFSFYLLVPYEYILKKSTFKFNFIHWRLLGTTLNSFSVTKKWTSTWKKSCWFTQLWILVMPHRPNGGHTGCLAMIKWIRPFQSMHNLPVWLDMNHCFNKGHEPITGGNRLAAHFAGSVEACTRLISASLSDLNVAAGTHRSHPDSFIYLW